MTFFDVYLEQIIRPKGLDETKARNWFSGNHEFVIDCYARELVSPEVSSEFFSLLNLEEPISEFISKLTSDPDYDTKFKELLSTFCKKTLFGLSKYVQESENWECPVHLDNVYRFQWFHFVIGNEVDWGLRALIDPAVPQRQMALSIPPQHGKSFLMSGMTPAMIMGNKPRIHGLLASYKEDMAKTIISRDFTPCIASKGYKELFRSLFSTNLTKNVKDQWREEGRKLPVDTTNEKGTVYNGLLFAGSVSQVTGKRGGFVLLDDPIKDYKQAVSDAEIETLNNNIETSLDTRVTSRTFLAMVQTRWREDDPVGVLQSKNKELREEGVDITLSALCFRAFYDPTDEFGFDFRTTKNEMLWPEFQEISYAKAKIAKSRMVYNALFQQRPIDFAETIFKEKNINRFATIDNIDFIKLAISVDTNYKDKETSDKCAIGVIGLTKEYRYYLLNIVYDHMTFPEALNEIFKVIRQYPNYTEILVEAKSNGQAIIDTLKLKLPAVVEVEPCDSKRARAYAVQPVFESGKIYIMDNRDGDTAVQQICGFKGLGKREKDDIVDILTQTINYYDEQFKASLQSEDITVVRNESNLLDFTPNSGNSQEMRATFDKINNSIFDKYKGNCNWL